MIDVLLDALIDSLKVLGVAFILFVILSFIENSLASRLSKSRKFGPLVGALVGVVPQCGVSVVASDLYLKKAITMGTLLAVFISCSDESLPILLASSYWYHGLILIGIKFLAGFVVGLIVDIVYQRKAELYDNPDNEVHVGCCGHHIDDNEEPPLHTHLIHPLLHSLKIFVYVFVINIIFGIIIFYVGEDNILNFLVTNKYLSPLFATLIGFIPNCVSSVIISEFYLVGGIPFSALIAGLTVNAGLGMAYLFKSKQGLKHLWLIILILFVVALALGYGLIFIAF